MLVLVKDTCPKVLVNVSVSKRHIPLSVSKLYPIVLVNVSVSKRHIP